MTNEIRFDDGAAYERYMGKWSQLAGERFLDWLDPQPAWRWLDVGCGNGAFTEMLAVRRAPRSVHGVDPSDAQLRYAIARPVSRVAHFYRADAMALPFADAAFDAAVMPLVIFFVPDPLKGAAEMARVLRPGGVGSAYAWDMDGGGFPYHVVRDELAAMGIGVPDPPSRHASRIEVLRDIWTAAGFEAIEMISIDVERTFGSSDDYWTTILGGASVRRILAAMTAANLANLRERLRARLPADSAGRLTLRARANAVQGRTAGGGTVSSRR